MNLSTILVANLGKIFISLGIFIASAVFQAIIKKTLKVTFSKFKFKLGEERYTRTNTIRILITNIINSVIFLLTILTVLSTWGINIAPILTGIGIVGVALSFGSQSLVKDLIGGFFIIVEDQFRVGDTIKVGNYEGIVRKITIRSTVISDENKNRVYIPNSKIDIVTRIKPKPDKKAKEKKK